MQFVFCNWCKTKFQRSKKNKKFCSLFCRRNANNYYKQRKSKYKRCEYWSSQQNKRVVLKSSFELTYCQYLDFNNIKWLYEPKRFFMDDGKTYYLPDFYLPETNEWHEVKGRWYSKAKIKFNTFLRLYPNETIKVIDAKIINEIRKKYKF